MQKTPFAVRCRPPAIKARPHSWQYATGEAFELAPALAPVLLPKLSLSSITAPPLLAQDAPHSLKMLQPQCPYREAAGPSICARISLTLDCTRYTMRRP